MFGNLIATTKWCISLFHIFSKFWKQDKNLLFLSFVCLFLANIATVSNTFVKFSAKNSEDNKQKWAEQRNNCHRMEAIFPAGNAYQFCIQRGRITMSVLIWYVKRNWKFAHTSWHLFDEMILIDSDFTIESFFFMLCEIIMSHKFSRRWFSEFWHEFFPSISRGIFCFRNFKANDWSKLFSSTKHTQANLNISLFSRKES